VGPAALGNREIRTALARVMMVGRRSLWIVDDLSSGLRQHEVEKWLSPHTSVPALITTRDRSLAGHAIQEFLADLRQIGY